MDAYKRYEPIFGEWTITKLLGEGSFGKVYEMERVDFGRTYKAALKIITVPSNMSELKNAMFESMDQSSVVDYFYSCVEEVIDEFTLMSKLKGNSNIVSYENHKVIEHTNEIGWDILIQMELLTPLNEYISKTQLTQWDVIKLGIDICKALEVCHRYNIIHRDIKPENIFISDLGDYKLGDFGIARTIEKTTNGLSKKGTYGYMAPEVYKGDSYGTSVDIYSLGLVLYRLMNNNRLPFFPPYPSPIRYSDQEQAMLRRIQGDPIPKPQNASIRLAEIILKAISYKPEERYSSPEAMRKELESIQYHKSEGVVIFPEGDRLQVDYQESAEKIEEHSISDKIDNTNFISNEIVEKNGVPEKQLDCVSNRSNSKMFIIAMLGIIIIILIGILCYVNRERVGDYTVDDKKQTSLKVSEPDDAINSVIENNEESYDESRQDKEMQFNEQNSNKIYSPQDEWTRWIDVNMSALEDEYMYSHSINEIANNIYQSGKIYFRDENGDYTSQIYVKESLILVDDSPLEYFECKVKKDKDNGVYFDSMIKIADTLEMSIMEIAEGKATDKDYYWLKVEVTNTADEINNANEWRYINSVENSLVNQSVAWKLGNTLGDVGLNDSMIEWILSEDGVTGSMSDDVLCRNWNERNSEYNIEINENGLEVSKLDMKNMYLTKIVLDNLNNNFSENSRINSYMLLLPREFGLLD